MVIIYLLFCFRAEAGIVCNFFLNFEQKWASRSYKIVVKEKIYKREHKCKFID